MAARPRNKQYRHFPDFLNFDKARQRYVLTLISGKRKTIGTDRAYAIAVAREYNLRMRPEIAVSLDGLVKESGGIKGEGQPLSYHIDRLMERIIQDEKPSESTLADWKNDAIRVKEFFADIACCDISLEHVNEYINFYHSDGSANVKNRKVTFLKKIFSYAMDESLMLDNPAERKKKRRIDKKQRRRLSLDDFLKIRASAEPWLRTAMDLALQTTQARLEVGRIRYNIKSPQEGVCGCMWYQEPQNGIYGMLYIHRQKVHDKEASHVAIPIGEKLKQIIDDSRDSVASPYVVHRLPKRMPRKISAEVQHPTQVAPDYLSRAFSDLRDKVGVAAHLSIEQKPTFHEIRALAAHLFDQLGIDPQARMAHTDAKSTKIYTQNHIDWVSVPHAEIKVG
ncbi:phage integrase SAM-like domain-containing protein [Photorhabdus kleinii]|uniref:phage integrase SAM-like domain-containing protein n=1 Tax=Photorhabdus kleinii TaxID=768034 RepID=UPI0021D5011B|nr:phage integrase SAM-like domain-containing protein [Photorhabdus kleinii]MCT8345114.1 phage integrase SAM-like domain-containing protein [Photorhabdus kleinii]